MRMQLQVGQLRPKWAWRIARGAFSEIEYAYLRVERDGIVGWGEAAHNARYKESLVSVKAMLSRVEPLLKDVALRSIDDTARWVSSLEGIAGSARACLEMALFDWIARRNDEPLWSALGLGAVPKLVTSYSLGIDSEAVLETKLAEAAPYPILKIKLGTEDDEATLQMIRRHTDKPLWVDANEGWTDRALALDRAQMMGGMGVELIEQPMPAGRYDDVAWLRGRVDLPLVADEDLTSWDDLPKLAACYDGVNVKVMKVGGLHPAKVLMEEARRLELRVMLGCMIESSLGITAAAHLASLVDWLDLDGALLLAEDPFVGATFPEGALRLPEAPGVGCRLSRVAGACGLGEGE